MVSNDWWLWLVLTSWFFRDFLICCWCSIPSLVFIIKFLFVKFLEDQRHCHGNRNHLQHNKTLRCLIGESYSLQSSAQNLNFPASLAWFVWRLWNNKWWWPDDIGCDVSTKILLCSIRKPTTTGQPYLHSGFQSKWNQLTQLCQPDVAIQRNSLCLILPRILK